MSQKSAKSAAELESMIMAELREHPECESAGAAVTRSMGVAWDAVLIRESCPFRKFHPAWIRIVRQNHRIIESDVCDPVRARNVRRRPVQVAVPA